MILIISSHVRRVRRIKRMLILDHSENCYRPWWTPPEFSLGRKFSDDHRNLIISFIHCSDSLLLSADGLCCKVNRVGTAHNSPSVVKLPSHLLCSVKPLTPGGLIWTQQWTDRSLINMLSWDFCYPLIINSFQVS